MVIRVMGMGMAIHTAAIIHMAIIDRIRATATILGQDTGPTDTAIIVTTGIITTIGTKLT